MTATESKSRALFLIAAIFAMVLFCFEASFAQDQRRSILSDTLTSGPLPVGTVAPDFTMKYFDGKTTTSVSLSQLRGRKTVVLAFFVFAFTGGCGQELQNFEEVLSELEATNVVVFGVSLDSPFTNYAFGKMMGLSFPLLSDWDSGGAVVKRYGAYLPEYRTARRIVYVIDQSGVISAAYIDSDAMNIGKIVSWCKKGIATKMY